MLEISGVHTFYGRIEALRGVDLRVDEGEIVTLIGANGAGKSTLLMTICGNPRAARGHIRFLDRDITKLQTYEIMRMGISQAPEGRRIFPRMTVLENLQMGATPAAPEYFDDDLERVFGLFPILKERAGQRGGTLSGGEQQMLAIARALMTNPRLLLLDEPIEGLAPIVVEQIAAVLTVLKERGLTILLVEQNLAFATAFADSIVVLGKGRVRWHGTPAELRAADAVKGRWLGV
jgi:branched-chain amino acid transport system ATP-binding protein